MTTVNSAESSLRATVGLCSTTRWGNASGIATSTGLPVLRCIVHTYRDHLFLKIAECYNVTADKALGGNRRLRFRLKQLEIYSRENHEMTEELPRIEEEYEKCRESVFNLGLQRKTHQNPNYVPSKRDTIQ